MSKTKKGKFSDTNLYTIICLHPTAKKATNQRQQALVFFLNIIIIVAHKPEC